MVLSSTVILASTLLGRQGPQACTSSPCSPPSLEEREQGAEKTLSRCSQEPGPPPCGLRAGPLD